jgi:alkanesulfonate monooxygenase SsuD/methylene tetrahydromethanopterin reductase-like flavin-dependent oxidoreductase (luciferase family)
MRMKCGLLLLPFLGALDRPVSANIETTRAVVRAASTRGFEWISASQHLIAHPTRWPQPFLVLAHLASEAGSMRLMTQMLLLPLHNPVTVAEEVATLDHISNGRITLGVAIGYRDVEMEAVGIMRKERAGRMEEALRLMKRLWTGEEVTHQGSFYRVTKARMGFAPVQQPHPPVVMAAQSPAAAARAGRLGDGIFFGPQISWADMRKLIAVYRQARKEAGKLGDGLIGSSRSIMLSRDRETAVSEGRAYMERTFKMYSGWSMQEKSMVDLQLSAENVDEWAILGSPADCVAAIERVEKEVGLTHVSLSCYNLPSDPAARIEYVMRLGEEVVRKV